MDEALNKKGDAPEAAVKETGTVEFQMKRINEKLQQLVKQYLLLQKENEKYKQDNKLLTAKQQGLAAESEKLQQQVEILKISKGAMTPEDKKVFEQRLSQYIKEIDRCIGLLGE